MQTTKRFFRIGLSFFAALWLCKAVPCAVAAPVTFWFSGKIDYVYNPSNALPNDVVIGSHFSGRITYNGAWMSSSNWASFPSGNTMNTYYTNTAGFSILVQVAGNTITNASNPDGYPSGYVGVYDQYDNNDSMTLETSSGDLIVNGTPTLQGKSFPLLSLYLRDLTKTAFSSASLPTNPPSINQFQDQKAFAWEQILDDGMGTRVFSASGSITAISTNPIVALNIRRQANSVQLGWPSAVSGFVLQSCTNLTTGNWLTVPNPVTDAGMEHTVLLPAAADLRFFRLKSGQ